MTVFSAMDTPARLAFVTASGATAQFFDETVAGWVQAGLNYTGPADGLGSWTYHRSDLHPTFWAVRKVDDAIVAYASSEAFAQEITEAMTDYPESQPG